MRITVKITPDELQELSGVKTDKPELTALEALMYQHGVRAVSLTKEAERK